MRHPDQQDDTNDLWPRGARVLLVDDDETVRRPIARVLERNGYRVFHAGGVTEAVSICTRHAIDLALVDYRLPDGSALDFLKAVADAHTAAMVLTGHGTIDLAVQAMQLGAANFLTKPIEFKTLLLHVEQVLFQRRLQRRFEAANARRSDGPNPFAGAHGHMDRVRELAEVALTTDAPVLILGETGTGKGVLARWMHQNGLRAHEPFVDLNCAGLSKELVESDLFGHQKGAFTHAVAGKKGLLEVAHRGSVFLDEIGDLDLAVQPKLLKVLEDRSFRRLGDVVNREVDVRIIAATHRNLSEMVAAERFRRDLLFRINTLTIELPPLRERADDIAELSQSILGHLCARRGQPAPPLSAAATARLQGHSWPGNLRDLKKVLERALLFHRSGELAATSIQLAEAPSDLWVPDSGVRSLRDTERDAICRALELAGGRVVEAAQALGIPRSSMYAKLKQYGLRR